MEKQPLEAARGDSRCPRVTLEAAMEARTPRTHTESSQQDQELGHNNSPELVFNIPNALSFLLWS